MAASAPNVRASNETDEQAGDRSNDALRVTAAEVGAKVIGEGANLGLTQRGRIELAQRGCRLNTDFIDNSAGVNSSDLEVNIKIALGEPTQAGELTGDARAAFLAAMTGDVAAACLVNNYEQSLALSLAELRSGDDARGQVRLMRALEQRRLLDRRLEALPSDSELVSREKAGKPLTRPELAVLLSYSKIALTDDLLASKVPDMPATQSLLTHYMPQKLRSSYPAEVAAHRLRREIIATAVTNAVINRAGATFVAALADDASRATPDVAVAYLAAAHIHDFDDVYRRIDALDAKIGGAVQNDLYLGVQGLLHQCMRDLLRDGRATSDFETVVAANRRVRQVLREGRAKVLPDATVAAIKAGADGLAAKGLPADLAADIAGLAIMSDVPAIERLVRETSAPVDEVARAYFSIGADLKLPGLKAKAAKVRLVDEFDALAIGQAVQQISAAQAGFVRAALAAAASPTSRDGWAADYREDTKSARALIERIEAAGEAVTVSRLVVAATRLRDLADGMA